MTEQQLIDEGYKDGKKSFKCLSKEIDENFEWARVHKAMIALEWYWFFGKDETNMDKLGIPSIETIKNNAYGLLKMAYEDGKTHSTGGFSAGWEHNCLYLTFTLCEWSTD